MCRGGAVIYLGIDQSLTGTGACLLTPDRSGYDTRVIRSRETGGKRLVDIRDSLDTWVHECLNGDLGVIWCAAIEGYAYGAPGNAFHLGEIGGVMKAWLEDSRIPYIVVNPQHLKMWVKGTPGGPKGVIMAYLVQDMGVMLTDDNAADAYALACVAMDYHGHWPNAPKTVKMIEARARVMKELKLDPHQILRKATKKRLAEAG